MGPVYRHTNDVEERIAIGTTTIAVDWKYSGVEMATRYSPVGEGENFRNGQDEDVFSDIETSTTVDEKGTHLPKARSWKNPCTIAVAILVATAFPIAFMAALAALKETYTIDSPVPRSTFDLSS